MTTYPLRFTGWQPSAEGGCGQAIWELPGAICPRTKGAVPAEEVLFAARISGGLPTCEPICKRCRASLMEQAYPVEELEQRALLAKHSTWKGLR